MKPARLNHFLKSHASDTVMLMTDPGIVTAWELAGLYRALSGFNCTVTDELGNQIYSTLSGHETLCGFLRHKSAFTPRGCRNCIKQASEVARLLNSKPKYLDNCIVLPEVAITQCTYGIKLFSVSCQPSDHLLEHELENVLPFLRNVKLIVHFHGASFLGLDIGPYQDLHKQIRSVFDLLCVDQHDLEPCLRHIYQILTTTHPSLSSDFKQIIGVDRRNDEILINDWLLAWNQQKHRVTVPTTNLYHLLCGFRASSLALVTGLWHTRVALAHKDRETVLDNLPLSQEYPNPGLHL